MSLRATLSKYLIKLCVLVSGSKEDQWALEILRLSRRDLTRAYARQNISNRTFALRELGLVEDDLKYIRERGKALSTHRKSPSRFHKFLNFCLHSKKSRKDSWKSQPEAAILAEIHSLKDLTTDEAIAKMVSLCFQLYWKRHYSI